MVADEVIQRSLTFHEWHDFFSGLTLDEFNTVMHAAFHSGKKIEITLLCALARKLHEHGHFSSGLGLSERTALITRADTIMAFALANAEVGHRARLEAAWSASKDECARFGFSSGPIWEVLAPHRVFRTC